MIEDWWEIEMEINKDKATDALKGLNFNNTIKKIIFCYNVELFDEITCDL